MRHTQTCVKRPTLRRNISLLLFAACLIFSFAVFAQTPQAKPQDQPFVVEYYYKARWGFADEFIRLFKKNHYPVLKKQVEAGRMLQVSAVRPRYHSTEDGRWDYRVTIVFKNLEAAHSVGDEEAIVKQLYPDQETFRREEQRRFEILLAHWDVPIVNVTLEP
jgi:hypothetical protein